MKKERKCRKCGTVFESWRRLKDHWYDSHPVEYKAVEKWLDRDVDELRRLEKKAAEGLQGVWAGHDREIGRIKRKWSNS